jgi:hypothetical protein
MGCVYTLGHQPGSQVLNNFCSDVQSWYSQQTVISTNHDKSWKLPLFGCKQVDDSFGGTGTTEVGRTTPTKARATVFVEEIRHILTRKFWGITPVFLQFQSKTADIFLWQMAALPELFQNNVATRTKCAGHHQHYGTDNHILNNIVIYRCTK